MENLKWFLQRVGALCHAIRDVRPKTRSDIREAASELLREVEQEIQRMKTESQAGKPEDDTAK